MFNPLNNPNDPLAIGLQQRARARRFADMQQDPYAGMMGLPDEQWDAYFQAVREAGGKRNVNFAGGGDASSEVDPNGSAGSLFAAHSNQFRGTPSVQPTRLALDGLKKPRRG